MFLKEYDKLKSSERKGYLENAIVLLRESKQMKKLELAPLQRQIANLQQEISEIDQQLNFLVQQ
ncbi:MAG: hypothetical protein UT24_C0034G0011 [Candidatus Woesebacteria bacterium GW2011_GWB1_39_12]|uniref:Uncharacterized protein n=1 Tax=Candidatus Woesebacteria bacterium GW2011_GWB1_39_12 TaxID=1618574 RepID=A0A0G0M3T8_9BACT|nr:MAG: hypothetical protein UT24_C0034G0011 [Candidatus Woesebacteria bacterium GW2011_GWB1_39_12]